MSARKFSPGDVALVRNQFGVWNRAICAVRSGYRGFVWSYGVADDISPMTADARPLVVIDPEDAEQVDRVCKVLVEAMHAAGDVASAANGVHPATVAAALREFASPTPRMEEPAAVGSTVIASCPHNSTRGRWIKGFDGNWWPEVRLRYGATERGNRAMPDDWADLVDPEVDPS